jgi:hypothetical protein
VKKWISLLGIACLLLVSVLPLTSCTGNQELYQYYTQLAYQYETAAVGEEAQAQYYFQLAQGLSQLPNFSQEQYNEMMQVGNTHQENAKQYRQLADQYRLKAAQYR